MHYSRKPWRVRPCSLFVTAALAGAALPAQALAVGTPLQFVRVVSGLADPIFVTSPPGDTTRLFIAERGSQTSGLARIRIFDRATSALRVAPFLALNVNIAGERGLLGLAFHPNYAVNGHLYVVMSEPAGVYNRVMRFSVSPTDPNAADAASATTILKYDMGGNHNAGWLGFGPDGMLYVATGERGNGALAQQLGVLNGKILRIDVDGDDYPADPERNYAIPPDNPFVAVAGAAPEVYVLGLRNPWRCSFDRATGDLYIGNVGSNYYEEIDVVPGGSGGGQNFGWPCDEGPRCLTSPACVCGSPALTQPLYAWGRGDGICALIGGYVYRGKIWDLRGTYFCANYCGGQVRSFSVAASPLTIRDRTAELWASQASHNSLYSWGEDSDGELYVCMANEDAVYQLRPRGAIVGDMNADGLLNFDDVEPFVQALIDPAGYTAAYHQDAQVFGDTDLNGRTDFDDIESFVRLLAAP